MWRGGSCKRWSAPLRRCVKSTATPEPSGGAGSEPDASQGSQAAPAACPRARPAYRILAAVSASHMVDDMMQSLILAMYPVLKGNFALSFALWLPRARARGGRVQARVDGEPFLQRHRLPAATARGGCGKTGETVASRAREAWNLRSRPVWCSARPPTWEACWARSSRSWTPRHPASTGQARRCVDHSARHGVIRGIQRGTAARNASYSAPNVCSSVGSSYATTKTWKKSQSSAP